MTIWAWALELILIALLSATLFYALRLERSIGVLRRDRAGLNDVLATIRTALDDADRGLLSLQHMADVTGRALTAEIETATQAKSDMQYLLDRLESVAAKVETVIKTGRSVASSEDSFSGAFQSAGPQPANSPGAPQPGTAPPGAPQPGAPQPGASKPAYSKAERDLLKVLRLSK